MTYTRQAKDIKMKNEPSFFVMILGCLFIIVLVVGIGYIFGAGFWASMPSKIQTETKVIDMPFLEGSVR